MAYSHRPEPSVAATASGCYVPVVVSCSDDRGGGGGPLASCRLAGVCEELRLDDSGPLDLLDLDR